MMTEYAEAALEYLQTRKDDPEGTKDIKPPKKPIISIRFRGLRDSDAADRKVEALSAMLDRASKKKAGNGGAR